jgi:U3 small nucleolar ribonucleoprotein protein IMP4
MADRRHARLRREYLYKKSLEGKEREAYEQKEALRLSLATGAPLPTELRRGAAALKAAADLEDDATSRLRSHVDDEYASAGYRDPKVCVTTSRDPSSRLRQFASEVRLLFPGAVRFNRGATSLGDVVAAARDADFSDIVVLQETRGEPDALVVSHLPYGPTAFFTLSGAVLRHEIEGRPPVSEAAPRLIFAGFTTPLGRRVQDILKHLFPPPKADSARVLTFSNESDFISFRHHTFVGGKGAGEGGGAKAAAAAAAAVAITEVGPRWEMRPYQIKLGTLEQDTAETEWVLKSFTNTARKRDVL